MTTNEDPEARNRKGFIAGAHDAHIRDSAETDGKAWCGASVNAGWCFRDVDHAALAGRRRDSVLPCADCWYEVIRALTHHRRRKEK